MNRKKFQHVLLSLCIHDQEQCSLEEQVRHNKPMPDRGTNRICFLTLDEKKTHNFSYKKRLGIFG